MNLSTKLDRQYLLETIRLSSFCPPSSTAFAVGASLVDEQGRVIATGFSRELGADWHAEAVALRKVGGDNFPIFRPDQKITLYSSMEPCSIRKSGKKPCCERIIEAGITRVVFGIHEPKDFVICQGTQTLTAAGIIVEHLPGFEKEIESILLGNRR